MGPVAAGAAVVGAGIAIYGQIKSAQDQADAANQRAALGHMQAVEVMQREAINESIRQDNVRQAKLSFGAAFAGTGLAGGGVAGQLELQRQTDLANAVSFRDSQFQSYMFQQGANLETTAAQQDLSAGYIGAAGTGASLIGRAANPNSGIFPNTNAPSSLPSLPRGT